MDENYETVTNYKTIATEYLRFWFWIDMIAIIPFSLFIRDGEAANLIRFIRIGRITKILKLLKLMRLIKMQKSSSFSIQTWLMEAINISPDYKWFGKFFAYFFMTTHIVCCCWIIFAKVDANIDDNFLTIFDMDQENPEEFKSVGEVYMMSFYFTVTTITTVGYGDMSASTFQEQIICSFIMLIGVIAFSMASGALTNYISDQEEKQAALLEKMGTLEKLQETYALPRDLYIKL
jgi:hypothetical protein